MKRKAKAPPKPSGKRLSESITITIAPKMEGAEMNALEHSVTVGTNNKQTSLFLKKGECVNFDVCASNTSNSGYELVTNDFESCSIPDKPELEKKEAAVSKQVPNYLEGMRPFNSNDEQTLKHSSDYDIPKVNVRMVSNIKENKTAKQSLSNMMIMTQTDRRNSTTKAAEFIKMGNSTGKIVENALKKDNMQNREPCYYSPVNDLEFKGSVEESDGVFNEKLIRPSTVSEEYVSRLSKICMELSGKSGHIGSVNSCGTCENRRGLGVRVKDLINNVFTPKDENPRVLSKIDIPERSFHFETLIRIYESK
ncbi:hypothetical protein PAEPH01_0233 [Pancytospora epiphaga]|nr:hypothetical protein PAEPH01_0233 [Pancytospora epiphaga]